MRGVTCSDVINLSPDFAASLCFTELWGVCQLIVLVLPATLLYFTTAFFSEKANINPLYKTSQSKQLAGEHSGALRARYFPQYLVRLKTEIIGKLIFDLHPPGGQTPFSIYWMCK